MNHCRDCNSDYEKPGTCNCFAAGGKRSTAPAAWPYPVYVPFPYTPYVPYSPPYWGTITVGDLPNGSTITTTGYDGAVIGGNISIQNACPPGTSWSFTGGGSC